MFCLYPFACYKSPPSGAWPHPAAPSSQTSCSAPQCKHHHTGLGSIWPVPKPPTAAWLCTCHFAGVLQLSSISQQHFSVISAESEKTSRRAAAPPRGNALLRDNYVEFKKGLSAAKLLHIQAPGQEGRARKLLFGTVRKYLAPAPIMGVHCPWAKVNPHMAAPRH